MLRLRSYLILSVFVQHGACLGAPAEQPSPPTGPTCLRIVAEINGAAELHISHCKAVWVDRSAKAAPTVQLNGRAWRPQDRPVWIVQPRDPLLRPDIELAGATLTTVRARDPVAPGFGRDGLIVRFDDRPRNEAGVYEVLVTFADALCEESRRASQAESARTADVTITAQIEFSDDLRLSSESAEWIHQKGEWPRDVVIDGRRWEPQKKATLAAMVPFFPKGIDLFGAVLTKRRGRGQVHVLKDRDFFTIHFDDRDDELDRLFPPGRSDDRDDAKSDQYEVHLSIPIAPSWKVAVESEVPQFTSGAPLRILRYPESGSEPEILPGGRALDVRGRAVVALPSGVYQFEVLHQPHPDVLVALKTGRVEIRGPQVIPLRSLLARPTVLGSDGAAKFELTELGVRSILPTGDLTWRRASASKVGKPLVILSEGQTYRLRILAGAGQTHAAIWKEVSASDVQSIRWRDEECIRCGLTWHNDALRPVQAGAVLRFPDGQMEFSLEGEPQFLTNRRFVAIAYWLTLENGRKVVFHSRGYVLPPAPSHHAFVLGGPLTAHASAAVLRGRGFRSRGGRGRSTGGAGEAVLKDRSPDGRRAKRLWWDVSLRDLQGHVVNTRQSTLDLKASLLMRDGREPPKPPLSNAAIRMLGDFSDTLRLSVNYHLEKPVEIELSPGAFVPKQSTHFRTTAPAYMDWRTAVYLAKCQRSLRLIGEVRGRPVPESRRIELYWHLRTSALYSGGNITMPLFDLVNVFDWYSQPRALSHELLHCFGYGHQAEMHRTDDLVKEQFRRFQWYVADHPEFVPDEWPPSAEGR